jgi:short subunit dehydrogenase-like uncharacterized protein
MPDVLLFGATGYTGKLTARALSDRGVSFVVAGRDRSRLEEVARDCRAVSTATASADAEELVDVIEDGGGFKVLLTCVGPFHRLGHAAAEAAVRAGVNYIDSTGEQFFIANLLDDYDARAREIGIAMAPAMAFDEVPADVAATLATEDMERPELVLTYALPSQGSAGTAKSALDVISRAGPWIIDGEQILISAGEHERWAPMPAPLGPRRAVSFPFGEGRLAPLHLDLADFQTYVTLGGAQRVGLKALPALRAALRTPLGRNLLEGMIGLVARPPEPGEATTPWTILAEASSGDKRRSVALSGNDVYGLSARLLATAASRMCEPDFDQKGVVSPVQAVGLDRLQKELIDNDVSIDTFG